METKLLVCATSDNSVNWHDINWRQVYQKVRRLQVRIVKAAQENKWNKVKALQHLLTHSFSGKALAVRRVTENQGKHTPGVDRVIWDTPTKKANAISSLQQKGYQPLPLRRVYIPKNNGEKRPLSIPTMKDRAMQALYLLALEPLAETMGDPNSYGFRKQRSTADAIEQCFNVLAPSRMAEWILEGDIKSCFDRISHKWLLENIPMDKTILRKWLKAGYLDKGVFNMMDEGTPQGGIISPVLANMALDGLEKRLKEMFSPNRRPKPKVNFVRYADDFIVTGVSKELLETQVLPFIQQFMGERGLELSIEKTHITHIEDGFDFLGQNIRKYNGKLLIKPSKKNITRFLEKVRQTIKSNKTATAGNLILLLNPMILGWANYHRHVVSKKVFSNIDKAIFEALWQWARRRHHNKGARWVRNRYFRSIGTRSWVFTGVVRDKGDQQREVRLASAARVPIQRHTKINSQANPFDPKWEIYFERRIAAKMMNNPLRKKSLQRLWSSQNGICPICNQKITEETGWHRHHIIALSNGGLDIPSNLVLLHPNCHRQVHAHKLSIAKPRSNRSVTKA